MQANACPNCHALPPKCLPSLLVTAGKGALRAWYSILGMHFTGQWCLVPSDAVHDPQHWAPKSAGRGRRLGVVGDDWADASTTHPSAVCQRSQSHVFVCNRRNKGQRAGTTADEWLVFVAGAWREGWRFGICQGLVPARFWTCVAFWKRMHRSHN
jgi:hypothetical protein